MRSKGLLIAGTLVVAVLAAGIASGAIPDGNEINACYDTKTGAVRVVDLATGTPEGCSAKERSLSWGLQGPQGEQGPAGSFSGTFTSPNGHFSISVTNDGLRLAGGGGAIEISDTGITVEGDGDLALRSDHDVIVTSGDATTITAGGTAEIEGAAGVNIKSSGDVTIKGSKIDQN